MAVWFRTLFCVSIFALGSLMDLNSQGNSGSAQEGSPQVAEAERGFKIRIAVEEVRLDAVVIDKKGRQITDLTADDFVIYQNDLRQKVTSCIYIRDQQLPPEKAVVLSKDSGKIPMIPPPALTPGNVRRTIAFIVDNLSMSFEHLHYARRSLEKFVKDQMQPGDLVVILPTSGANASFQTFTSDKRHLLAMIRNLRWYIDARILRNASSSMTISYCLQALRDMPGRKSLVLMSAQTTQASPLMNVMNPDLVVIAPSMGGAYNMLADAALRAGIVIHTLDIRGLEVGDMSEQEAAIKGSETPIPLSKMTGGLFVKDINWFVDGIGPVNEEMKGYYLLTYVPPDYTFKAEGRGRYHRIKIKVKRPGSEVHTRDGFYGMPGTFEAQPQSQLTLRQTIFSPFRYNDLKVNLAFGYVDDAPKGYQLRSWLHLDGRDLSVVEEKDGANSITVDTACVTSGMSNYMNDSGNLRYMFRIKKENIAWVREHGLRFSLSLPVKKPGAYYARVAVKDPASGKVGSAYQFIEIPDLKKHRLALSSIFIVNQDEDAPGKQPIAAGGTRVFDPDLRRDPRRSPALRNYLPGDSFEYTAVIYNAKSKENLNPDLELQYVLYKDGGELFKSEPEAVRLEGVSDFDSIPIRKRLLLEKTAEPGDYVLQLLVKDKLAKEKQSLAAQTLDFQISAK